MGIFPVFDGLYPSTPAPAILPEFEPIKIYGLCVHIGKPSYLIISYIYICTCYIKCLFRFHKLVCQWLPRSHGNPVDKHRPCDAFLFLHPTVHSRQVQTLSQVTIYQVPLHLSKHTLRSSLGDATRLWHVLTSNDHVMTCVPSYYKRMACSLYKYLICHSSPGAHAPWIYK